MKKIIITSLTVALFYVLLHSCKKGDISGDSKDLILGSYITLDSVINSNLDVSNAAATVSLKVAKVVGSPISSVNIYAATGSPEDTSTWVLIKNVPYTAGLVLSVTTGELAKAYGSTPLQPGNQYTLQNEVVTTDGRKFSVANTPDTYNSFPAYNMALTFVVTAICPYVQSETVGAYKVTKDTWVDYAVNSPITVTAGPGANEINFPMYPGLQAGGNQQVNTVVDINPATGSATVKSQQTGYYGAATAGNLVTVSGSGFVFSCTGVITLTMTINVGGTPYSGYVFTISK